MVLDDLGLFPTLRKFIPEIAKRENLLILLNISGKERRLSSPIEVALFRLIQELLNNVIKHANATKVNVNIESNDNYIRTTVEDNGQGFIEEEALKSKDHFGLIGLKERIQQFEGKYEIKSVIRVGTTISFEIPINEGEEEESE